jgi:adenylate cyclase
MNSLFHKKAKNTHPLENQFNEEIGKSKRLRAAILAGLLGFEGIFLLFIYLLFSEKYMSVIHSQIAIFAVLVFVVIIIVYETLVHYLIRKKKYYSENTKRFSGYLNVFSEVSLLSLLLVVIILGSGETMILHSPAALTYFIFIILSTLRLEFKISLFTGLLSAFEFVLVSLICSTQCLDSINNTLGVTPIQYLGQGLIMITAGIAAGFVADLIKKKMKSSYQTVREKNQVIDLFGQQISQQIATEILKNPSELKGIRKEVCVMFLDIRDFTPFAEKKQPEEVVAYLNSLFSYMIEIVQKHHGIINQFLGDGFMATFGAPLAEGNSCQQALNASVEIVKETERQMQAGVIPDTRLGIGIHFGEAVTGNIGSAMRKQYSITGNVVILAARIEQLTKDYRLPILFSGEVFQQLEDGHHSGIKEIGTSAIKGREKPVKLYGIQPVKKTYKSNQYEHNQ